MSLKRVLPASHRRAKLAEAVDLDLDLDVNAELLDGVRELESERHHRRTPGSPLAVCVAVVVEDAAGRLLLLRRSAAHTFPGTWCFPGGRVEPGETLGECCRRELAEETGLVAGRFEFGCRTEVEGPPHLLGLVFLASGVTGEARNLEPDRHDEIGWFERDRFPAPLMPGAAMWLRGEGLRLPGVGGVEDLNVPLDPGTLPKLPGAADGPRLTRVHRKTERSPEERRELAEVRERFQEQKPTMEDLLATGDYEEVPGSVAGVLGKTTVERTGEGRS